MKAASYVMVVPHIIQYWSIINTCSLTLMVLDVPYFVKRPFLEGYPWCGTLRLRMTTLTPSYHAENYSPDDNRGWDLPTPRSLRKIPQILEVKITTLGMLTSGSVWQFSMLHPTNVLEIFDDFSTSWTKKKITSPTLNW